MMINSIPKEKGSKIDVTRLREFHSTNDNFKKINNIQIAKIMEMLKEYQSYLSKELPSERYNGIINLLYIIYNPKATSDQIESALVMCNSNRNNLKFKFRFEMFFSI